MDRKTLDMISMFVIPLIFHLAHLVLLGLMAFLVDTHFMCKAFSCKISCFSIFDFNSFFLLLHLFLLFEDNFIHSIFGKNIMFFAAYWCFFMRLVLIFYFKTQHAMVVEFFSGTFCGDFHIKNDVSQKVIIDSHDP